MSKMLLVFKNELVNTVARRSFLITLFLLPLVTSGLILLIAALQPGQAPNPVSQVLAPTPSKVSALGFVDQSGLVKTVPPWLAPGEMRRFESEAAAEGALTQKQIGGYYLIPPNWLASGKVTLVRPGGSPLTDGFMTQPMRETLDYNLLNGDVSLARRLADPVVLEQKYLSVEPQHDPNNALSFFLPYLVTILFYIIILSTASLLLNSITTEKQNRVMEILVTSLTPIDLLAGKIPALGLVGLMQTVVWTLVGFGLTRLGGKTFEIPAAFQFSPSILLWGVLFFLLGFALYGTIMAGLGALAPSMREASQVTTVVILPLMIPLVLISVLVRDPNGVLAVVLSLVPLTAPVTVMMRLAATAPPLWQLLLSAALLVISALLMVRFVAGLFRAQNLLSGQEFNWKVFLKALAGRV